VYLIPTNLYGERDNFAEQSSHVIPAIIRKMHAAKQAGAKSITLWGDGSPTREFLYVKDAAAAIVQAAQCYNEGEPVNLGTGFEISIADLAELIAGIVGFKGGIRWDASQPNGQPRRSLDTTRALEKFDWRAETYLAEGIRKTVRWYEHGNL
ncbi:MAG: NAD-dependent epimerase/dehydratase family protein, partial [Anaerolineae bacterium]|nr:NAD-dependent epimerase/dehydratase family protein [Anaerolineae bacterium]